MLTWSSKEKEKELAQGHYFCPNCSAFRPYTQKRVSKYLTFAFIALFETETHGEFVECQVCKKGFDPEVLQSFNQIMFRLGAEFPEEQLHRSSLACIKAKLIEKGAPEDIADKIITMAQGRAVDMPIKPLHGVFLWGEGSQIFTQT